MAAALLRGPLYSDSRSVCQPTEGVSESTRHRWPYKEPGAATTTNENIREAVSGDLTFAATTFAALWRHLRIEGKDNPDTF